MAKDQRPAVLTYTAGFILSLLLTLVAFSLADRNVSGRTAYSITFMMAALAALAVTQLLVHLVFFLHLSPQSKARWNLTVLSFAGLVVLILVFGSLWIMQNLNYHHGGHGPPQPTDTYIIHDEGISH